MKKRQWKIQLGYALGNGVARNDHGEPIGEEFILEECMIEKGRLRDAPHPDTKPVSAAKRLIGGKEVGRSAVIAVAESRQWSVFAHIENGAVTRFVARYGLQPGEREYQEETFLGLLRTLSAVHDAEEA